VVDKTGLMGLFDVLSNLRPIERRFRPSPTWGPPINTSDEPPGSIWPSIFTAIQEQLGLDWNQPRPS